MGDRPLPLAFGSVAQTYDRVRPPYFRPLLERAQEVLELGSDACVLDLGAGSGRLTRELAARFGSVIAVEPDDEVREQPRAHRKLFAQIEAEERGIGESDVLAFEPDADFGEHLCVGDAVFVGEAFHWFDATRAITEIARVLRPRGALAIISTHWWETDPPLPESVLELLREPYERTAQQRRPRWDEAFEASPFQPLRYENFEEAITVDANRLLALYSTTSALAALSHDEREALCANVRPRLAGPYRLPIKHELCWTRLA